MPNDKNTPAWKKGDPNKPALMKHLWAGLNDISEAAEGHLQNFHKELIQWQQSVNMAVNTVNLIVIALKLKGILSDEDMAAATRELWKRGGENVAAAKKGEPAPHKSELETVLTAAAKEVESIVGGARNDVTSGVPVESDPTATTEEKSHGTEDQNG